jgi:hypothetical protein
MLNAEYNLYNDYHDEDARSVIAKRKVQNSLPGPEKNKLLQKHFFALLNNNPLFANRKEPTNSF